MWYYSTRDRSIRADFSFAALTGLAPDGGLFIPETIPPYPPAVCSSLGSMDFQDIALETIKPYVHPVISGAALEALVQSAFTFPAPLVRVGDRLALELFHGPTAAFKDFGARFMARSFAYLRRNENRPLHILTATSGDTGGAVADGFFGVPGIEVTILYPKGRVSPLQERQIAGLGGNISALAVEGSFDDCQALVKAAFTHRELQKRRTLSSANSINISRLIPQAVYYAAAAGRALSGRVDPGGEATPRSPGAGAGANEGPSPSGKAATFCVPSGNFGNLTAGLYAMEMGAPIQGFIAATNRNRTVPDYLHTGNYHPRPSEATISNAMDVGAPSNFERMAAHWSYEALRRRVLGVSVTDEETRRAVAAVYQDAAYYLDPHGAVGWHGASRAEVEGRLQSGPLAILATAHPAKFAGVVEPITGPVPVPPALASVMDRSVAVKTIPAAITALCEAL